MEKINKERTSYRVFSKTKKSVGFTLIELLVVIAIISILASVAAASYSTVRKSSRDGVRKSDLHQIVAGLELYRSDVGSYPTTLPGCGQPLPNPTDASKIYIKSIPCDPTNGSSSYTYPGTPSTCLPGYCRTYTLNTCLENTNDVDCDKSGGVCITCTTVGGGQGVSYSVPNP